MNRTRLGSINANAGDLEGGLFSYDRNFLVTDLNSVMEQLFSLKREGCLGKNIFEIFPAFVENGEEDSFRSALRGETVISRGKRYPLNGGSKLVLFETQFTPIFNEEGQVQGGSVLLKPQETRSGYRYEPSGETLAKWLTQLSSLLQWPLQRDENAVLQEATNLLGECSGFDRNYLVFFKGSTSRVSQLFGWSRVGVPSAVPELQDLELKDDLPSLSEQLLTGSILNIDTHLGYPDGEGPEVKYLKQQGIDTLWLFPILKDGELIGVIGFEICTDEKNNSRIADNLLQSLVVLVSNGVVRLKGSGTKLPINVTTNTGQYQDLTEAVSLGLFVVNEKGKCLFVNEQFETITGLNNKQVLGDGLKRHLFVGPDGSWIDDWLGSIEKGAPFEGAYPYEDPNGTLMWLRLRVSLINPAKNNDEPGFVGTLEDITAQQVAEENMIKSERYQRIINYFATSLLGKNTLHDILNDLTHNCISNLDFLDCVIYLLDHKTDTLIQKSGFGKKRDNDNRLIGGMNLPLGKGIVGSVALSKVAEIVPDTTKDPRYIMDEEIRLSEITVPIIYEGELLGIIDSEHPEKNFFNEDHLRVLSTIASLAANKIVRVQAEDQLAESLERVDLALEGGNLGLWDWDVPTGTMTYNRRWAEMLGYTLQDIEPTVNNWDKVMHPDDKPTIMGGLERHLSGDSGFYESEHRMRTKNGEWKWILDRGKVTKWDRKGNPLRVTGTHLDITERKLAEQALQESEDKFKSSFENASVGMMLSDKEGKMYQVNPAFARMLGFEVEELIGANFRDITIADDIDQNLDLFVQLINGDINSYHLEKRYRHKKGYTITGLLSCSLVREFNGEPSFIIAQVKDITDRKNAEEELRQLTDELLRSNAELNQFAYITSHNLRAPVVNLKSLLMLFNKSNPLDDDNPLIIDKLELSVNQLSITLEDLVQVVAVKHTTGGQSERINLSNLISRVEASIADQMNRSETKVIADFSEAPELTYPKSHLESIVLNLLTNAIKYRSPKRTPIIRITSKRENGFFRLSVRDNGMGIDLSRHGDDLFGLYKRFHNHVEGKGLGLYIIKSQVDALGGKIEVGSELGKGTTFNVFLKEGQMQQESR